MAHGDPNAQGLSRRPPVRVSFASLAEERPGPRWRQVFDAGWPGWSEWLGGRVTGEPAELRRAERALRRHMPELAPLWEQLVDVAGADARAAQFLTFWTPPRYLVHCAQAVIEDDEGPLLIRNYDLDPALNEGFLYRTGWLGRPVIGMVDGLAGLADGMNDAGLAVSLAFGGRVVTGRGFGVPLILRYLLQVCTEVPDAVEALRGLPCHMAYNLTLVDRRGRHATVLMSPDRPAIVQDARFATNHQLGVEWPQHARLSRTLERADYLGEALADAGVGAEGLRRRFLAPPLHCRGYGHGYGTVYTALYRPAQGRMQLAWPGLAPWRQGFDGFAEGTRSLRYIDGHAPVEEHAPPARHTDRRPAPAAR